MKTYIETDDTSQATGAYLSYNSRTREGHIPVKEVKLPTDEEIEEKVASIGDELGIEACAGANEMKQWLLSKLK